MSITTHASLSKSLDATADDELVTVGIRMLPGATTSQASYHLALLLDVSGSMEGDRLDSVKRTLHLLLDSMSTDTYITLIAYSSRASILAQGMPVNDTTKPGLRESIEGLVAGGGTNLEIGLLELYKVAQNTEGNPISAVFLMTDGHINLGVSTTPGLLRILSSVVPHGTAVNTLGYGAEHNASLLRDMAIRNHGSYTFADVGEMLPTIIGDIVGGLSSTVATDAELRIPDGWTCCEMGTVCDGVYKIGALIAEKPQWVVLTCPKRSDLVLPHLVCSWKMGDERVEQTITIDDTLPQNTVLEQYYRTVVATVFASITSFLESGQYTEAREKLTELLTRLTSCLVSSQPFVISLIGQVEDMLAGIPAMPSRVIESPPRVASPVGWTYARPVSPPTDPTDLAPMLSRLASNTAALGGQRGYLLSRHHDPTTLANGATFSSPRQRNVANTLTSHYSQQMNP